MDIITLTVTILYLWLECTSVYSLVSLYICILGATGRAFLFNKVVNLNYSEVQDRVMLTGRHMVRDVSCKNCDAKLGWVYEFATEDNQRYKEGRVILERALVTESEGIEEHISHDGWKTKGNKCCLKNVYIQKLCVYFEDNDSQILGMSVSPDKVFVQVLRQGICPCEVSLNG